MCSAIGDVCSVAGVGKEVLVPANYLVDNLLNGSLM
jgi:hypothetical protein